jgi:hypothetical protein
MDRAHRPVLKEGANCILKSREIKGIRRKNRWFLGKLSVVIH